MTIFALVAQPLVALNIPSAFAASVSVSPASQTINAKQTKVSKIDASGYQSLILTFDYAAGKLEKFATEGDSLAYGWRVDGGVDNPLGVIEGATGDPGPGEDGSKTHSLPTEAAVSKLEVYFTNTGVTSGTNDRVEISNIAINGNTISAPVATLSAENFNTVDANYKGISVGFNASNFGTVTDVTVTMERASGGHVTKTANQGVKDLISNRDGPVQLTTPFVIEEGVFTEASDTDYWQPAPAQWDSTTFPTNVIISVADENGTKTVENSTFNQGPPSWPAYESLLAQQPDPTNSNHLTLSGTVFHNLNSDRDRDTGEDVLANWTVRAYRENSAGEWLSAGGTTTRSNDNKYAISQQEAGVYHVCVVNKLGWTQVRQDWSGTQYHVVTDNRSGAIDEGEWCSTVNYDDTADHSNAKNFGVLDIADPETAFTSPLSGAAIRTTDIAGLLSDNNTVTQYSFNVSGPVSWSTNKFSPGSGNVMFALNLCDEDRLNSCDESTLPDGEYKVRVAAYDGAGNRDISTNIMLMLDTTPPTLALNSVPNSTNTSRIISGTSEPLANIEVTVHSTPQTKSTIADLNGNWSILFEGLEAGDHTVRVISTDPSGNVSEQLSGFAVFAVTSVVQFFTPPTLTVTPTVQPFTQGFIGNNPNETISIDDGAATIIDNGEADNSTVLSAQDDETGTPLEDTEVLGLTDEKFFGLVWYWWLITIAALVGGWLLIAAAIRHSRNQE